MMHREQLEPPPSVMSFKTEKNSGERSFYDTMWIHPRYPYLKKH